MWTMTIRNIDDELKPKLRQRAAANGRSMEEEVRQILQERLGGSESGSEFVQRIRQAVEPYGGFDIELPERQPAPPPIDFDK